MGLSGTTGVIVPAQIVRTSLQKVAAVSGSLLTTEAMTADKPEKGGGGMPDMGSTGEMPGMMSVRVQRLCFASDEAPA